MTDVEDRIMRASFQVKNQLSPVLWGSDKHLRPAVESRVQTVVKQILDSMALGFDPSEILLTGSAANFNWSAASDLDIHILFDFKEIVGGTPLTEEGLFNLLMAAGSGWNDRHDIRIRGFEVELYLGRDDEALVSDAGAYSLLRKEWVHEPVAFMTDQPMTPEVEEQVKQWVTRIGGILGLLQTDPAEAALQARELRMDLRQARSQSVHDEGELGTLNVAFKVLRRSGYLNKLAVASAEAYDQMMSMEEQRA